MSFNCVDIMKVQLIGKITSDECHLTINIDVGIFWHLSFSIETPREIFHIVHSDITKDVCLTTVLV